MSNLKISLDELECDGYVSDTLFDPVIACRIRGISTMECTFKKPIILGALNFNQAKGRTIYVSKHLSILDKRYIFSFLLACHILGLDSDKNTIYKINKPVSNEREKEADKLAKKWLIKESELFSLHKTFSNIGYKEQLLISELSTMFKVSTNLMRIRLKELNLI